MPDWDPLLIDPAINRRDIVSIGWLMQSGRKFSTSMPFIGAGVTPDPGNVSAFRAAVGALSNAGVIRMTEQRITFLAEKNARFFDETHGEGMQLQVYLQNNNGIKIDFMVPAPDASIFDSDGKTLDLTNAAVIAFAAAAQTLINNSYDPANSFAVIGGILRDRGDRSFAGSLAIKPTLSEPAGADTPPDAPAT